MRKILTIARREYMAMVATKAFIISIAIMPIFMFGSLLFTTMSEKFSKEKDKEIAVFDSTGELFSQLQIAVGTYNKAIDEMGYKGWIGCEYKPATTTVEGLGWAAEYLGS